MFVTDNKPIPTDLRKEAISIHKTLDWEDEGADGRWYRFMLEETRNTQNIYVIYCNGHLTLEM